MADGPGESSLIPLLEILENNSNYTWSLKDALELTCSLTYSS